jgi:hypothetical protein
MRVRAHGMQQATDYPGPVAVLVTATALVAVTVFVVMVVFVTRPVTLTRPVIPTVLVVVTVLVIMTELVIVVRATPAVHIISMREKTHCRTSTRTRGAHLRIDRTTPRPNADTRLNRPLLLSCGLPPVHGFEEGCRP